MTDEGRWLEGLDERTERDRMEAALTPTPPPERLTVHAWGFYDHGGNPKLPDGIAVSAETPHAAFQRIRSNIAHHGGICTNTRTWRTMDGWFVGAAWETPEREDGSAARMWHKVAREADSWPEPVRTTPGEWGD